MREGTARLSAKSSHHVCIRMMLRTWHLTQRWLCGQKLEEKTSEDIRLVFCPSAVEVGSGKGFCSSAFSSQFVSRCSLLHVVASRLICDTYRYIRAWSLSLAPLLYRLGVWATPHVLRKQQCRPVFGDRQSWIHILTYHMFDL